MFSRAMTGLIVAGLLLSAQAAVAGEDRGHKYAKDRDYERDSGYDYARVVDVEPIVRNVRVSTPRRECWMETRYESVPRYEQQRVAGPRPRGAAGSMILGGIIGAAIGNQVGSGDGRRAAPVAGAIIGSATTARTCATRRSTTTRIRMTSGRMKWSAATCGTTRTTRSASRAIA
jgi:uncharacterized protein YcfJ